MFMTCTAVENTKNKQIGTRLLFNIYVCNGFFIAAGSLGTLKYKEKLVKSLNESTTWVICPLGDYFREGSFPESKGLWLDDSPLGGVTCAVTSPGRYARAHWSTPRAHVCLWCVMNCWSMFQLCLFGKWQEFCIVLQYYCKCLLSIVDYTIQCI